MTPEASIEQTEHGLRSDGKGWFVLNAKEGRWRNREGRGFSIPLTGWSDEECETLFPQLGVNLSVLAPGEPIGMYHWEADQEAFLVLYGEPLLIIEGEERQLRQWDFVHVPPGADHMIIGAGDGPSGVLAMGSREHIGEDCNGGSYVADELAAKHGASAPETTSDGNVAYARFPETEPTTYREGWLPGGG